MLQTWGRKRREMVKITDWKRHVGQPFPKVDRQLNKPERGGTREGGRERESERERERERERELALENFTRIVV